MNTDQTIARFPQERTTRPDTTPPSLGRIVHYGQTPMAAIIVGVNDNKKTVNLRAWGDDGTSEFGIRDVPYSTKPAAGCWSWPTR